MWSPANTQQTGGVQTPPGEWRPTPTVLKQTIDNLLALRDPRQRAHTQACVMIDAYETNPDVTPTLAFVFSKTGEETARASSLLGNGTSYGMIGGAIWGSRSGDAPSAWSTSSGATACAPPTDGMRQLAGMLLHRQIASSYRKMPPQVQAYVKARALDAGGDPSSSRVRSTAGSVITEVGSRDDGSCQRSSIHHYE